MRLVVRAQEKGLSERMKEKLNTTEVDEVNNY